MMLDRLLWPPVCGAPAQFCPVSLSAVTLPCRILRGIPLGMPIDEYQYNSLGLFLTMGCGGFAAIAIP